jgi:hypothetical protein
MKGYWYFTGKYNGLSAFVDVDVFDGDFLLPFAPMSTQRLKQCRVSVRESLFAWLKFSRRPSNVCSGSIALR